MKNRGWTAVGCVLGALVLLALFNLFSTPSTSRRSLPSTDYSRLVADVDEGKVEHVVFRGSTITGRLKDGGFFESAVPHAQVIPAFTDRLLAKGVAVAARPASDEEVPSVLSVLINWLPLILFYAVLYFGFARPLLVVARRIEAFVKAMQEQSSRPPSSPA